MAEAADAEDGDGVAGARSAVAQGVEGGDAGAEQRGGVGVGEVVGDEGEGVGGGDDVVGIAAVVVDAGDELVFAEDEVAAAAGRAVVAVAAVPAEADALAGLEERHVGADGVDDAGDFVAGDARDIGCRATWPTLVSESLWQTPQACTRMRTWPGPGSGNSFWTSSNAPPAAGTCMARPVTVGMGKSSPAAWMKSQAVEVAKDWLASSGFGVG